MTNKSQKILNKFFNEDFKELYHYTNLTSCYQILKSGLKNGTELEKNKDSNVDTTFVSFTTFDDKDIVTNTGAISGQCRLVFDYSKLKSLSTFRSHTEVGNLKIRYPKNTQEYRLNTEQDSFSIFTYLKRVDFIIPDNETRLAQIIKILDLNDIKYGFIGSE